MQKAGLEQNKFAPLTLGTATLYIGIKPIHKEASATHFATAARPNPIAEPVAQ
jgi:hypothetical protein